MSSICAPLAYSSCTSGGSGAPITASTSVSVDTAGNAGRSGRVLVTVYVGGRWPVSCPTSSVTTASKAPSGKIRSSSTTGLVRPMGSSFRT